MIERECRTFYQMGIWPGPGEIKEDFLRRARIQNSLADIPIFPIKLQEQLNTITLDLFHFAISCIPTNFSNQDLMPWEGAALYVEEVDEVEIARIQLRKKFLKGSLLFYKTEEVLSHEAFHAARLKYLSPRYEEIFAYKTSKSSLRRFIGPIFQSPKEAKIFVFISFFSLFIQHLLGVTVGAMLPLAALVFFLLRLFIRHMRVQRALKYVKAHLKRKEDALAVLCRLTDEEIDSFARLGSAYVGKYFANNMHTDLRLTLLCDLFIK